MYNRYLANALVQLGHRVTVISARHLKADPSLEIDGQIPIVRLYRPYPYRLHRLPFLGRHMRAAEQLLYSCRVAQELNRLIRRTPVDVIEFADVNAEGFTYLKQKKRIPVVVRCHTPTFVLKDFAPAGSMGYSTRLIIWMEKAAIRLADSLTAPSVDMAETIAQACNLLPGDIQVVPNALDVDRFCPQERVEETQGQNRNRVTVLHVGRMDPVKGVQVLAEAIPHVIKQTPNVHFVFIGKGKEYSRKLSVFFKARGVSRHITILGLVNEKTLLDWYHRSDIAVVPTVNYESFSYTCAQAIAAGLPVVASRIGGIPETVIDGETGLLVPPGDVQQLVEALVRLIRDEPLRQRMRIRGPKHARNRFDARRVAEQMVQIYRGVIV